MTDWCEALSTKESYAEGFKVEYLEDADITFAGSTSMLALYSKRYENYMATFMQSDEGILGHIDRTLVTGVKAKNEIIANLNESLTKYTILEEWDLCYSQIVFESERTEIEAGVMRAFGEVNNVLKIYSSQYEDQALHFQILTSNVKYNRDLSIKLLNIEYDLGHKYKHIGLSFNYIPKVYNTEDEVVVQESNLIYTGGNQKLLYEFTASAFTTSLSQQAVGQTIIPVPATI